MKRPLLVPSVLVLALLAIFSVLYDAPPLSVPSPLSTPPSSPTSPSATSEPTAVAAPSQSSAVQEHQVLGAHYVYYRQLPHQPSSQSPHLVWTP